MRNYQNMVYITTAMRLLGNPETDAADISQEVFLQAFRHFSELSASTRRAGWLQKSSHHQPLSQPPFPLPFPLAVFLRNVCHLTRRGRTFPPRSRPRSRTNRRWPSDDQQQILQTAPCCIFQPPSVFRWCFFISRR